jgi:N-acetylmuramoyl-L-alanine amidase
MSNLYTPRKVTKFIVIHCSATPPKLDVGAKDIRQWHRQKGWIDIGYHKVIRRDGSVEDGRPLDVVGAHVEGHNSTSIGICLVGGVDEKNQPQDNFTPAQWDALAALLSDLVKAYPGCTIQGHRDFPGVKKACPSFDVAAWLKKRFPDGKLD